MATVFTCWNNSHYVYAAFFFQHTLFSQGMIEEVILKQQENRSDCEKDRGRKVREVGSSKT